MYTFQDLYSLIMIGVSVETLEELKEIWFRQITCVFHSVNIGSKIHLPIFINWNNFCVIFVKM